VRPGICEWSGGVLLSGARAGQRGRGPLPGGRPRCWAETGDSRRIGGEEERRRGPTGGASYTATGDWMSSFTGGVLDFVILREISIKLYYWGVYDWLKKNLLISIFNKQVLKKSRINCNVFKEPFWRGARV
jgi:hypothetical protein